MGTVIQYKQRSNDDRHQRWERLERADLLQQYDDLKAQGLSQRQVAQVLEVPRTTLQAWRAYQESLDACPAVVAFFHSVPGLAFLHRLVVALHLVFTEVGACGIRLVCLFLRITGLDRFVGASYGAQQRVNGRVEEAIVAYRREESARLAHEMPAKDITVAQDETFTGGLCLVGIDPVSNYILLEQAAQARDQDTWQELMAQALAGLNCQVIQSTSDEAPGLLAYVEHHLGAHHSPDVFHVQHELSKAVSAPMAAKQRAAVKAATKAEETLKRVQEPSPLSRVCVPSAVQAQAAPRGDSMSRAGCPGCGSSAPRAPASRRAARTGHAEHSRHRPRLPLCGLGARRASQRHAHCGGYPAAHRHDSYHCSTGRAQRDVPRSHRKAERVVPKMQATIEFVSGYVRQQVRQLDLTPPVSYAMHAHLIPALYLDRVASTRTVTAGEPLRELAERMRTPLFASGGALRHLSLAEQSQLHEAAAKLADVFQRSSSNVEGRNGYLSLRHHQLRGLDHPRKRVCLTAVHNFFLTRPDGTTAAERFFGQKPRSMFIAILGAVEIPPAPLSPPLRAVG